MQKQPSSPPPPIFVVSGGVGASGEQTVQTVLAQFPDNGINVIVAGKVRQPAQIESVLQHAKDSGGCVVHTLVDPQLRSFLETRASEMKVNAIDLMGPLIDHISNLLGREPLGRPGLYRMIHRDYFERVDAIDYTMLQDDGKNPSGWQEAEIVLAGVSRSGKTPLSLYLAVMGWKVANIPIIPQVNLAPEFFNIDHNRLIGLTIEPGQLIQLRQQRQMRLGTSGASEYVDPQRIFQEIEYVESFLRSRGVTLINVTDKPIETSADEVLRIITRRLVSKNS